MDRNLQNFLAVAEAGSFSGASAKFGISQPALSKSIQKLEGLYGVELFERQARGVILTPFGVLLQRRAIAARNELNHARQEIRAMQRGSDAMLRIGCGPMWAMRVVPEILKKLEDEFEGFRSDVTLQHRAGLIEKLEAHELDVAVSSFFEPPSSAAIGFEELHSVTSIIVAREAHPVHAHNPRTMDDLRGYRWTNLLRNQFNENLSSGTLNRIPADPDVTLTTNSLNIALGHTALTDNLLILPEAIEDQLGAHGLKVVAFPEPVREFSTGLYYLRSSRSAPSVQRFIQLAHAWDRERVSSPRAASSGLKSGKR